MTATIGGQNMVFNCYASLYNNPRTLIIVASSGSDSYDYQLEFYLLNPPSNYIGTYKLGYYQNYPTFNPQPKNSCVTYEFGPYWPDGPPNFIAIYDSDSTHPGVITVTGFNPAYQTISGTFSFIGYQGSSKNLSFPNSINVNNGNFFAQLQ